MKDQVLDILRNTDGFVSGEAISSRLQVSRAAIWKAVNKLRETGYEIASVTNKGYQLVSIPDILTPEELQNGLHTRFMGQTVQYFPQTDSTNNAAKRTWDLPEGTLFITEAQTDGRGRRGNAWASPPGSGIWMSLLLKPNLPPENIAEITLIAGLAVTRGINRHLPAPAQAGIKWPNDVVMNGKKICGILTELSAEIDAVNYVVTGIGINVNTPSFPADLENKATSLFLETGIKQNRAVLVRSVLEEFEKWYTDYLAQGFSAVSDAYKACCVTLGKQVRVTKGTESFTAQAVDLAAGGQLIVERDGEMVTINSGEVSVRGIYGYV